MPAGDWASYLYPGTEVLRNRFGLRDPVELAQREYRETTRRQEQLSRGTARVEATFDAEHLRALHRHLFGDVFDWAGQFRTVDIAKDGRSFAPTRLIGHYLAETRVAVAGVDWSGVDRAGFARGVAEVYAPLNQAHPFREGNGRTGRAFLDAVTAASPYRLDHSRVLPGEWNRASAASGPDPGYLAVHPERLVPVFTELTTDRPTPTASPSDPGAEALEALRVARLGNPRPARDAANRARYHQPDDPDLRRRTQQQRGDYRGQGYER